MTPRLVLALVRRGGISLLAAVALGWWAYYSDKVNREERAATEVSFRAERSADRATFADGMAKLATSCLHGGRH